jgi:hypothetical protein
MVTVRAIPYLAQRLPSMVAEEWPLQARPFPVAGMNVSPENPLDTRRRPAESGARTSTPRELAHVAFAFRSVYIYIKPVGSVYLARSESGASGTVARPAPRAVLLGPLHVRCYLARSACDATCFAPRAVLLGPLCAPHAHSLARFYTSSSFSNMLGIEFLMGKRRPDSGHTSVPSTTTVSSSAW